MRKRILITGHKGFLGSAIFSLLSQYHFVYGIDLQEGNDIFSMNGIAGIDVVVHCAALTSVEESFKVSEEYMRINILGTSHIVNLCLKGNVKLIYISSAAASDPDSSPYAYSKAVAEDIAVSFINQLGGVIFVPYNIYSLKPKKGSLFYNYLNNSEITINGKGKQTRDFINIIDACNIIQASIDDNWENEIVELGSGKGTSVQTIADIFAKETGKKIVYNKTDFGIKNSVADITYLRKHYKKPFRTNLKKDISEMTTRIN